MPVVPDVLDDMDGVVNQEQQFVSVDRRLDNPRFVLVSWRGHGEELLVDPVIVTYDANNGGSTVLQQLHAGVDTVKKKRRLQSMAWQNLHDKLDSSEETLGHDAEERRGELLVVGLRVHCVAKVLTACKI